MVLALAVSRWALDVFFVGAGVGIAGVGLSMLLEARG